MSRKKTIMLSGGFDPIHVGHIRMIQEASKFGEVIVVVNSDAWLLRKKGYCFMDFEDRCEIVRSIEGVKKVLSCDDTDDTVIDAIIKYKPDIFGNGGDRFMKNTPEAAICEKYEIETLWGLGGEKIRSSSTIIKKTKDLLYDDWL